MPLILADLGRREKPPGCYAMASKQALLFLKKKKQKDFLCWGMGCVAANAHAPESEKFFGSFFQKRTAFLSCCSAYG
jgi:hypothetical protein